MRIRNQLIIAAIIIVGIGSIAYAAFAQILTINGTGTATGDWDVAVTSITLTDSDGATDATIPSFTGTSATFDVDLAYPGAFAEYQVVITNAGNIAAIVDSVTDLTTKNAADPAYITYTVTGVPADTLLAADNAGTTDVNTATVRVEWDPLDNTGVATDTKTATINFDYVQDTP